MAVPRSVTVREAQAFGHSRLVTLEGEPLGFKGGQYVIVDAGVKLPNGKQAKRAYSILSADSEQGSFQLAAKDLGGPASGYLNRVEAGAAVPFSGPWGKFWAPEGMGGTSLVFVTDTAITAGLGLVRGLNFRGPAHLAWFVEGPDYFLPPDWVWALLQEGVTLEILPAPAVDHPDRLPAARAAFAALRERLMPAQVFLAGDGAVILPLKEEVEGALTEVYFNDPARKSAGGVA